MILYIQITIVLIILKINCAANIYPELQLVNVVFRHGDRDKNDGSNGELTNQGKQRAYHLGEILRAKYGDFLGDIYEHGAIFAQSTSYNRAKLSLELLLAALFLPQKQQRWHESLTWQPIPFFYSSSDNDILLFPTECPRFLQEIHKVEASEAYKELMSPYDEFLKNLSSFTNQKIELSKDVFLVYHMLTAMQMMNESLPSWADDIYPEGPLLDITYIEYKVLKFTDWMNKVNGGSLLRKIVDDMLDKINKKKSSRRKLFLYSSHELLLVALLQSLKIWSSTHSLIPPYSSAIILELWEYFKKYYVKIVYYDGTSEFTEFQIPGCASLCPLDIFIEKISDQLPTYSEIICRI